MTSASGSFPADIPDSTRVPAHWTFIRDLRAGAIVLILVAAAIAWAGWSGYLFDAFGLVVCGFVCGTPVLLVVMVLGRFTSRPAVGFIRRIAAQFLVVLVMSLPLLFGGSWAERLSIRTSQRRGDRIIAALEAYRMAHGTYPKSLASLEEHTKVSLPRPTTSADFMYEWEKDGLGYSLRFAGLGLFRDPWIRDSDSADWHRLD